ncbi:acidic amino acid decarboxylase GADL1 [Schistocerca americana]|uniref:acidic amino acid decarboxylase GADL1 n=1 Tax=Schistocerca americana TaxID=7009 RepID=UPI001F4FC483|nr:acidic amino acid decarboxylase GADL1 [Schistocerca americana]
MENGRRWDESEDADAFLARVLQLLREEGALNPGTDQPVVRFRHPAELQELLSLDLGTAVKSQEKLLALCRAVIQYSVKTNHRHFYNQLYGGTDTYGLAGAWITESLNTNQHTFEVSPAFTLVENAVLQHMLKIFGYTNGDGIFAPGGSLSNMYAMVLARYRAVPDVKMKGICGSQPLVAFVSEDAHYSFSKAAHWLGIGTDNLISVKTDEMGRMIVDELELRIQEAVSDGKRPFFVCATAGTTVLGAFDPIDQLANVCRKHKLWLHVDACWGGSLILSKKYSHRLTGIDRTDSVSWNAHKMLGAPLQCSAFLLKEKGLLHHCNSASATYLFQQDKFYDVSYDTGDKSVQCGRKVDAFKLWIMWKARGNEGFEYLVNNAMDCAQYFKKEISKRKGYRLVIPEFECTNVCFWFIPPRLRDKKENEEWWNEVDMVAPRLKESLVTSGTVMINYQPLKQKKFRNFFRLITTCHPPPTHHDMDFIISQIDLYGSQL